MSKTLGQNKSDFIEDFIKLIHYIDENELVASDIYDAGYRKVAELPTQDLTKLDVTFGELDRDTQLRLVSHVLDGGELQRFCGGEWELKSKRIHLLSFMADVKYRVLEVTKNEN